MKTTELTGATLDWAVAQAKGLDVRIFSPKRERTVCVHHGLIYNPSQDWILGFDIIERELTMITWSAQYRIDGWQADIKTPEINHTAYGKTPLLAAMRCFVLSKLGESLDLPPELLEKDINQPGLESCYEPA